MSKVTTLIAKAFKPSAKPGSSSSLSTTIRNSFKKTSRSGIKQKLEAAGLVAQSIIGHPKFSDFMASFLKTNLFQSLGRFCSPTPPSPFTPVIKKLPTPEPTPSKKTDSPTPYMVKPLPQPIPSSISTSLSSSQSTPSLKTPSRPKDIFANFRIGDNQNIPAGTRRWQFQKKDDYSTSFNDDIKKAFTQMQMPLATCLSGTAAPDKKRQAADEIITLLSPGLDPQLKEQLHGLLAGDLDIQDKKAILSGIVSDHLRTGNGEVKPFTFGTSTQWTDQHLQDITNGLLNIYTFEQAKGTPRFSNNN